MNRNFIFFLLLILLASCTSETKKAIKVEEESPFSISQEFFSDKKIFPKISSKYLQNKKTKIRKFYDEKFNSEKFSGGFLVAKNGQIIYEKYQGYSNFENGKKINSKTPIHLASVGKVLTATAIFRLVQTGKIQFDQLVNSILPSFPYNSITIRMLLNHRSGIPKYAYFASQDSIWNKQKTISNEDILKLLAKYKLPLDFEPNTKFTYNNSNYALLALVIEKLANQSFSKAMKSLVFDPIGMKNTFVMNLSKDSGTVSQSYKSNYQKVPFDFLDAVYGDKNIYSTPRDMMRYDMAMYNDQYISKQIKNEVYRGYSYEKAGVKNYGLGIRLKEWSDSQRLFYHNGWWHGNTSCYVTMKEEKVTIIVLSNKYTRRIYDAIKISALFGDYPFDIVE
ncbi:MAG: serine hydrolase domain-containing protein [Bacteroidota bacterium]